MTATFDHEGVAVVHLAAARQPVRRRDAPVRWLHRGCKRFRARLDTGASAITLAVSLSNVLRTPQRRALGGAGNLRLQFTQLGCGEPYLAGKRLAVMKAALSGAAISFSPCWAVTSTK